MVVLYILILIRRAPLSICKSKILNVTFQRPPGWYSISVNLHHRNLRQWNLRQ
jgi:hypothetical protein